MARGIIRITPKRDAPGQLEVQTADANLFGVQSGTILTFDDPGFTLKEGSTVDCTIKTATTCNVIKQV